MAFSIMICFMNNYVFCIIICFLQNDVFCIMIFFCIMMCILHNYMYWHNYMFFAERCVFLQSQQANRLRTSAAVIEFKISLLISGYLRVFFSFPSHIWDCGITPSAQGVILPVSMKSAISLPSLVFPHVFRYLEIVFLWYNHMYSAIAMQIFPLV